MRLIDADKIIDSLGISDMDFAIGEVIDKQPTAFDVDKVVDQLEEELELTEEEKKRCVIENYLQYDFAKGYAMGVYNAIDIVKGGGFE